MKPQSGTFWTSYAMFVGIAFLVAGAIAGIGYVPTVRIAGDGAVLSMVVGCGITWVSSCVGAAPLAMAASGDSSQAASSILLSTGLRFLVVLLLVAPLALSGWLERNVMVFWVAISYLLMLLVDSAFAIRIMKRINEPND